MTASTTTTATATTTSPTAEHPPTAWILVVTYTAPIERIEALLPSHVRYLDRFFASGEFLASGPRVPRRGGVIVASAVDRARVEAIVAADPFVVSGVATYAVVPFRPTRGPLAAALTGATAIDAGAPPPSLPESAHHRRHHPEGNTMRSNLLPRTSLARRTVVALAAAATLAVSGAACSPGSSPSAAATRTRHARPRAAVGTATGRRTVDDVVRRYTAAFNEADWTSFARLLAPGFVDHSPEPGQAPDKAGFLSISRMSRGAFADWTITNDAVLIDGTDAVIRFHGAGSNGATHVHLTGIRILRIQGGHVTDTWANWDALGFYRQLGIVPPSA